MRKIIVATYMTIDGVLQAGAGQQKDRSNEAGKSGDPIPVSIAICQRPAN